MDKINLTEAYQHGSQSVWETVILPKTASAVQLEAREDGGAKLGLISQIPCGAHIDICGDGYSERTVKVRYMDQFYFLFRDDLQIH